MAELLRVQRELVLAAGHNDEGFADIVEAMAGTGGVRWVPGIGWAAWDGVRWRLDERGWGETVIREWVVAAADIIAMAAAADQGDGRGEMAKARFKRAAALRNMRVWHSGLARLERRAHIRAAVEDDSWDANPWLVGLADGRVIELHEDGTHSVRAGRRQDMVTLALRADYAEGARCEVFQRVLERAYPGEELVAYLLRWFGYILTGSVDEQRFPLLWGEGRTCKSTICEALTAMMGSYALELLPGALVSSTNSAGELASIAQMRGKRLAVAVESDMSGRLNEAMVKRATGNATLTAKFMRANPFTFRNRAKLLLATNHRPEVRGTDDAIWRRICLIPCTEVIPLAQVEDWIKPYVQSDAGELSGLLWLALQGYAQWRRQGLDEPVAVVQATETYKETEDVFGAFLAETYVEDADAWVPGADLIADCAQWCAANHHEVYSSKRVGMELAARGFSREQQRINRRQTWVYRGLRTLSAVQAVEARRDLAGAETRHLRQITGEGQATPWS